MADQKRKKKARLESSRNPAENPEIASLRVRLAQQVAEIDRLALESDHRVARSKALEIERDRLSHGLVNAQQQLEQLAAQHQNDRESAHEKNSLETERLQAKLSRSDERASQLDLEIARLSSLLSARDIQLAQDAESDAEHRKRITQLENQLQQLVAETLIDQERTLREIRQQTDLIDAKNDAIARLERKGAEFRDIAESHTRLITEHRLYIQYLKDAKIIGSNADSHSIGAAHGSRWSRLLQLTKWTLGVRLGRQLRAERAIALLDCHPLFDRDYYLDTYPDVARSGFDPLYHYVHFGADEGRNPNAYFDSTFYLTQYPDVARAGMNPLAHYLAAGAAANRDPSKSFSTQSYREGTPFALETGMNPLLHYMLIGRHTDLRRDQP